jgi:DNA-binding MarR family transcriptional regulator
MQKAAADPTELVTALERLALWLRRNLPQAVSASTAGALDRLQAEGPLRVSDLAEREAMTQPGVTMLVNRLADAGLARRTPDPTDRRAALVSITAAGRAVLRERHAARTALLRRRLELLDDDDRDCLLAAAPALDHLLAAVDAAPDPHPDDPIRKKSVR